MILREAPCRRGGRAAVLLGPIAPVVAQLLAQRFEYGENGRPTRRGSRIELCQRRVFRLPDRGVVDELGVAQLLRPRRLELDIERIQRVAAGGTVGTEARRMQRIEADHARAELRRLLDHAAQVAEVADAPVARRAQAVELEREAPRAAALLEERRLVAAADVQAPRFRNLPVGS